MTDNHEDRMAQEEEYRLREMEGEKEEGWLVSAHRNVCLPGLMATFEHGFISTPADLEVDILELDQDEPDYNV